ncbi:MAG: DUF2802 domain-containing protein [Bdellovibrio sp.]|nr:DUF2802 domain-containing protein [Bdellovibrio sp.]
MNFWLLTLIFINLLLITFIIFNWVLRTKITQEDQRLTKGLQLLQNKISILQDLSDKSDEQVRRWVHLIEQKSSDVQAQLNFSDEKIIQMESVLSKALDVSKIFYDQVPHAEIMERQKTSKYVQAAQLANQGFTADQISQKIDMNAAEIEMIIRLNKEQLQFSEENLPAWIETMTTQANSITMTGQSDMSNHRQEIADFSQQLKKMNQMVSATAFDSQMPDLSGMQNITQKFNDSVARTTAAIPQTFVNDSQVSRTTTSQMVNSMEAGSGEKQVRPFEFRRITAYKN